MPDVGLFVAASALLALAPGPDIIYVLTRGMTQGRRAGFAAALGFASGCIFHTVLAAVGIAALIRSSELAFDVVRYAGAAYLIWIGIQALRHRSSFSIEGPNDSKALLTIYRQSVIGNMLNPKVTLFFLAFLPQFVDAQAGNVGWQMALLGVLFMLVTIVVFGAVAVFAAMIGDWVRRKPAIGERLNVFAGVTFIALGIRVALPDVANK
ncbi:MAG TPA: LysE family translocator [Usitatibacter sp.]|nr:LysE family translocator [Usitatibacter sp.]